MTHRRLALIALLVCAPVFAQEHGEHEGGEEKGAIEAPDSLKWANFALLAGGLGYLLAKSLPSAFRARTESIQKDIAAAQAAKQDADQRAAQMEARLNSLGAEIEAFKSNSAEEMRQEGERIRQETARQMSRIEAQSAFEIENAGKTARRDLSEHAAKLALQMAEDRIRQRADSAADGALIDSFVSELARQGAKN